jgi:hypothetical protein
MEARSMISLQKAKLSRVRLRRGGCKPSQERPIILGGDAFGDGPERGRP